MELGNSLTIQDRTSKMVILNTTESETGPMSDTTKRPGRRPRRGTPMPRTGFTAFPEQILFYLLLSGHQRAVSAGVQIAPSIMAGLSDDHKAMMNQAKWMTMRAREILEADTKPGDDEVSHDDVLRYALEHRDELEANYQERKD